MKSPLLVLTLLLYLAVADVVSGQDFLDRIGNVMRDNPVTNFVSGMTNRVTGPGAGWFGNSAGNSLTNGWGNGLFGGGGGGRSGGDGGNGGSFLGRMFNQAPIVGSCDRIAYQGIGNCMNNFRPSQVSSKGQCCAWRKYRACVQGIRDGIKIAARAQRCPQRSFSRSTIESLSDRLAGFPVSNCPSNSCKSKRTGR